jgi:hypothetical protein
MHAPSNIPCAPNKDGEFGIAYWPEPTISDLLADPLTSALMKADRVDQAAFAGMLQIVAGRLQARKRIALPAPATSKTGVEVKFQHALPSAARLTPVGRLSDSTADTDQSLLGAQAARAVKTICGSHCLW